MEESELIRYLKEKEERDRKEEKKKSNAKLALICSGLLISPLFLPNKEEVEW